MIRKDSLNLMNPPIYSCFKNSKKNLITDWWGNSCQLVSLSSIFVLKKSDQTVFIDCADFLKFSPKTLHDASTIAFFPKSKFKHVKNLESDKFLKWLNKM